MRVYVIVRSLGIARICSCVMTNMESVPLVLVTSSPWARFPNSFPNARDHVYDVSGSLASVLYFVIDAPVTGCMTGAQKCSQHHGMSCDAGLGANLWMAIAERAAFEYRRGESRAILGDLRVAVASGVLWVSTLGRCSNAASGSCVGVVAGLSIGVTLFRVFR